MSSLSAMQNSGLATVRVAFVELQDDIAGSEYGEILCLERGMTVHSFSDEGDARRWLLYGN